MRLLLLTAATVTLIYGCKFNQSIENASNTKSDTDEEACKYYADKAEKLSRGLNMVSVDLTVETLDKAQEITGDVSDNCSAQRYAEVTKDLEEALRNRDLTDKYQEAEAHQGMALTSPTLLEKPTMWNGKPATMWKIGNSSYVQQGDQWYRLLIRRP